MPKPSPNSLCHLSLAAAGRGERRRSGWTNSGAAGGDYGALGSTSPSVEQTGWLGFQAFGDDGSARSHRDGSRLSEGQTNRRPLAGAHELELEPPGFLTHRADTFTGESGSPVLLSRPEGYFATGIHHFGTEGFANSAVRFTPEILANINLWRR